MGSGTATIRTLYRRLLELYGPQHWWPAKTPFEVAVGAVLTQNTAWRNVERAIRNLKEHGCLSPRALLDCPLDKLKQLIRPAGFYNQKAQRLRALARIFLDDLSRLSTEELRNRLLSVKGIGKETADSILLYAFNRPVFVVDKYTYRIFRRMGLWKGSFDYEAIRAAVERELRQIKDLKEFHALLVEHAKRYCRKKPLCRDCPLREECSKLL